MSNYNQLKDVLNDIFELNKADLDFGIYRIMNQKRKQVNEFIENQLPEDIKQALSETQSSDKTEIENELKTLKKTLDDAGIVAEESPKYKTLKERLFGLENSEVLEQEVFSHLANFFKRYYKDGDFISLRRYKKDVYAIPYEGEEVKLHWANHDQYYIKSSENFNNYSFKTPDGKTVTFQLKEVSTEQNNNKAQGDIERKFGIYNEQPVEIIDGNLYLNFVYEPFNKATKQEILLTDAINILAEQIPADYGSVFTLSPTEKNTKRTLLEKHLNDYVSKNSFDYFIHKDLGGFLSRELDFYIKNEVLYLDDINTKQSDFFVAQLSKVKAIKVVSGKIIDFLAQIENFQKKLWLKKKFVLRTDYCITLDKIPSTYYPEILANKQQIKEWRALFDVDINSVEQLVFEQFLVLDTKFFDEGFKDRLLAEFDNLDEQTDGLLVNSENFQAINLIQEKFQNGVDTIYIDPPYNANSSEIIYKNTFKHSSWLSFMYDRLDLSKSILNEEGNYAIAIDEVEQEVLGQILNQLFTNSVKACLPMQHNPRGQQGKNISYCHEFMFLVYPSDSKKYINDVPKAKIDSRNLRDSGTESDRTDARNCFYPILVDPISKNIHGFGDVPEDNFHPASNNTIVENNIIAIWPIDDNGNEKKWRYARQTVDGIKHKLEAKSGRNNLQIILNQDLETLRSMLYDSKFDASEYGTKVLQDILGKKEAKNFSFPKSIETLKFTLAAISKLESTVLDYFGGSGTTAHAVISMNRKGGNRKYIIVAQY